jgi:hypothetical protein
MEESMQISDLFTQVLAGFNFIWQQPTGFQRLAEPDQPDLRTCKPIWQLPTASLARAGHILDSIKLPNNAGREGEYPSSLRTVNTRLNNTGLTASRYSAPTLMPTLFDLQTT